MESDADKMKKTAPRPRWKQDPEAVRSDILKVATAEFSENGLSGARIDEIAAKTKTSKRMIYYYFGDKAGLYRQVLEEAYRGVRAGEQQLELDHLPPVEGLRKLTEFTFDHHSRNPDFVRMIMIENIHRGRYLEQSTVIRDVNRTAILKLESIYRRGLDQGVFREGVTPLQLHWQISAFSFFNVSNRHTFALNFGETLFTPDGQAALRDRVADMVVNFAVVPSLRTTLGAAAAGE